VQKAGQKNTNHNDFSDILIKNQSNPSAYRAEGFD